MTLERELGKSVLDCQDVMKIIEDVGLMKTVINLGSCYEKLVKEFIVNIPEDCNDESSADFRKVYVRGKCVTFSPAVINRFLGRSDISQLEFEDTDDQVCQEITCNAVKHWPSLKKLSAGKLSVKYAILHRIGTINWVPTNHTSTISVALGRFICVLGKKKKFDFGACIF